MRTVSFSNPLVHDSLNSEFNATYSDTTGDPSAGLSFSHQPNDVPGNCGFGAGRQNVQSIFMTPEGEIFHIASGFRSGDDLLKEIHFAKETFENLTNAKVNERAASVVNSQLKRLKAAGFSADEINDGRAGSMGMLPKNSLMDFAPQDLGLNIESGTGFFEDMIDQRVLNDGRFVASHPLISKPEFETILEELVGNRKSFFGSHGMMNGEIFKSRRSRSPAPDSVNRPDRLDGDNGIFDSSSMTRSNNSRIFR